MPVPMVMVESKLPRTLSVSKVKACGPRRGEQAGGGHGAQPGEGAGGAGGEVHRFFSSGLVVVVLGAAFSAR